MKLFFYAYESWGYYPIWYFSYLCKKFSELRAFHFLSSTQTSQNLNLSKNAHDLSSLKNKFQWTQKFFDPSLERFWYGFFGILKAHGPKINPHPAPKDAILGSVPSISSEVLDLAKLDFGYHFIWPKERVTKAEQDSARKDTYKSSIKADPAPIHWKILVLAYFDPKSTF